MSAGDPLAHWWTLLSPGPYGFKSGGGAEHCGLIEAAADDLQADRQALGGEAARDRRRWLPGEVKQGRHGDPGPAVKRSTGNLRWAFDPHLEGRYGHCRTEQHIVGGEHTLNLIKDSAAAQDHARIVLARDALHLGDIGQQLRINLVLIPWIILQHGADMHMKKVLEEFSRIVKAGVDLLNAAAQFGESCHR